MTPGPSGGVVCVLFTDLVGSTELMSRLGDTAFDAVRGEHFDLLRAAIANGGGAEVKNTGDGILATFSSAVEALTAAVGMQQATLAHGQRLGEGLSVRIGLSLGEVSFEEGDIFGTPVVEAARLVGAARPGQILATAMVKMVAGNRCPVATRDVGSLELKGLADPVPVCEVNWEPARAATVPLPALVTGTGRVFVGRGGEVARLLGLWDEAAAGDLRIALVGGEPGVGKTRLAAEVARAAHDSGAVVLAGRCDEDLGVPYQPFVEALRQYVRGTPSPELRLGRHGGDLVRLLPELATVVDDLPEPLRSDPETERYRLFEAVAAWLSELSTQVPLLVVLDDLQWATKPTLLLIRHLTRTDERLRLLTVGTFRDTELSRAHPLSELLADLRREPRVDRVTLSGLDQAGVAEYLEVAAGHDLSDATRDLAQLVWKETEGNPFFVGEVMRHLIESGAVAKRDGRWGVSAGELGIPEGVREVVGRRLGRLSDPTNQVLTVAAVVGSVFDHAVIGVAAGLDEQAVCSALEEAETARLVVTLPGTAPASRFAHALVRATLYDEIAPTRRPGVHRRVAEAIETVYSGRLEEHVPALARHWVITAASNVTARQQAVFYARQAGDQALARLAPHEAATHYRSALNVLEADDATDARIELLIELGEALRRAGDPAHRETLLNAARLAQDAGDGEALARAALANGDGYFVSVIGGVDEDRVAALEAARSALPPSDSELRARVLSRLAVELVFISDHATRVALTDEALAMVRRLNDVSALADVLVCRFYAIAAPSTLAERQANAVQLLDLAATLGDKRLSCVALWQAMRAALESAEIAEALEYLRLLVELAGELGEPSLRWLATWSSVWPDLLAGRLAEAEQGAFETFEISQDASRPQGSLFLTAALFPIRLEQDRVAELEEPLREVALNPRVPLGRAMAARCLCEQGKVEAARELMEPLNASDFADLPLDTLWLWSATLSAEVCVCLGDSRSARALYDLLLPYPDHLVGPAQFSGSVSHYLGILAGLLDRFDLAERWLSAAEVISQRAGAPIWEARARVEQARLLKRRGGPSDRKRAEQLLAAARDTAVRLGLERLAREVKSLEVG